MSYHVYGLGSKSLHRVEPRDLEPVLAECPHDVTVAPDDVGESPGALASHAHLDECMRNVSGGNAFTLDKPQHELEIGRHLERCIKDTEPPETLPADIECGVRRMPALKESPP